MPHLKKMVLHGDISLFHLTLKFMQFKLTVYTLIRRRGLWRLISQRHV